MTIEYKPIGVFHSDLSPETNAPRQGMLQPENKAVIEIYDEYTEALRNLDECEYIIVIYHLNQSKGWQAIVTPPGTDKTFGLFSTRAPFRPNPIGFGIIKLNRVEGKNIYVSGVDAFEGTPVLDIKPWIPSIDTPADPKGDNILQNLGLE